MKESSFLDRLIASSLHRPAVVLIVVAVAAVLGALSLMGMPRDVYPDMTVPVFNIITQNPNAATEEMEFQVTLPFERSMSGLPGVKSVRSVSTMGISVVTVGFDTEMDYWRARQLVTERMAQVVSKLPPGTDPPVLGSLSSRISEVLILTLSGADLKTLRDTAEFDLRNRLLTVSGVGEVFVVGGELREYQALVDPARMMARGVSFREVVDALEKGNENASGGFLTQGATEKSIRGVGKIQDLVGLSQTVVAERDGYPVLVSDVADVVDGHAVRRGLVTLDGQEVVNVIVVKQFGTDTVGLVEGIKQEVQTLLPTLPAGIKVQATYDQTVLVHNALSGVQTAIWEGAALVVLVILIFLGNWRSTLIVTLSLPLGVLLAGIVLKATGQGLNTMTLGGLAIAVGIMVDASIIMVENIYLRLFHWKEFPVYRAAAEVARPIAFATLIIVAVFLPLYLMTGVEGRLFRALAITVSAVMLASLGLSLTLTPVLAKSWLKHSEGESEVAFIRWLKKLYVPALQASLAHPLVTVAVTTAVTVLAFLSLGSLGSAFLPELDEGALMINTYLPSETSLGEVDRVNRQVEAALRTFPEVTEVIRQSGRAERSEDPMPITLSDVQVNLQPRAQRKRGNEELVEAVRAELEKVPGVLPMFTTPLGMRIDESLAGTSAGISVKLFGPDYDELLRLADKAQNLMSRVPGVSDLKIDVPAPLAQLRIEVDRERAGRYGLQVADVMQQVRAAIGGQEVGEVTQGQRQYAIVVRLEKSYRDQEEVLGDLVVATPEGAWVPLAEIASIKTVYGASLVRREAVTRRVAIECNVEGRDLGSVVGDVRARLQELKLPPGYYYRFGGEIESQQRAFRSLLFAIGLALVLVFLLLYLALDSLAQAALILGTLPAAMVGGIISLHLTGESINVSSAIGFIALLGIAVQNGLVLFTQVNSLRREGESLEKAVVTASVERLRPKLMTASCAMLGFLPLVLSHRPGVEIERPLAIVTVGGLVTSTVFILLILPTVYRMLFKEDHHG